MTAGRPRKPTALKLLTGNPGKRPLSKREPKPKTTAIRPPARLSDFAKAHFKKTAKMLRAAKLSTNMDVDALALYCEAYERYVEAYEKVKDIGIIVKSPSGFPMQSPYLAVMNKAFEQMQKILTEFGMTPASRTKVQTEGINPKSDIDELFMT